MAARYLGEDFDIHGGGSDLIFPHHENEIAQSEGASGRPLARYWLHNGMLNLDGEKMSKSTGLMIDLPEAIKRFGGRALRLFYLRAHYRSPLDYTEELVESAGVALQRLDRFLTRAALGEEQADPELLARFVECMDDDFATPTALALIFDAINDANRALDDGSHPGSLIAAIREMVEVLGLGDGEETLEDLAGPIEELAATIGVGGTGSEEMLVALLDARSTARANGDFAGADAIRDRLSEIGLTIEDTADGTRWHRR
jgi:cysteinyl-tRNA synthetase